jgi:hypothetical protein
MQQLVSEPGRGHQRLGYIDGNTPQLLPEPRDWVCILAS